MSIKQRLTLQFVAVSGIIMAISLIAIYVLSENYREEEFYNRLSSRAVNIAKILITVEEIDEFLLYRIEQDNPVRLSEEAIKIFNYKNELIFMMDEKGAIEEDEAMFDRIRLDSSIKFRQGEREFLGFLFTARYDRFVVLASAVDVYGNRKIKNLRNVLFTVFAISLLIVFVAGRLYANRALHPMKKLIDQVEEITPANLTNRVNEGNGKDEIAQMARSFNLMLKRVEAAFKTQKNFIANASHEMRTPLTAITGQLEVLMLRERSTGEYIKTINSVLDDLHSLNRLANRLLLLAQTETNAQEASFTACRVDEIVWQCASELKKLRMNYHMDIEFDASIVDENALSVWGNEQLIKTVIINLMENGCKYSEDHRVQVTLAARNQKLILRFRDRGIGIPEKDLKNIFDPFFRGSNVRTRSGHGIGLSLVLRIVELHQGSVSIESAEGKGTIVSVELPLMTPVV